LILSEKNNFRIFEVPVEWMEDLDSRVNLSSTAWEDIQGLARMRMRNLRLNLERQNRAGTVATQTTRKQR
jgi:hypothetical protein